jgi:hypothetical protein
MKQKKAQSMSINTVIVAILGILILVILIFIIANNIQKFTGTTESCTARQGSCKSKPSSSSTASACDLLREIEVKNMNDCGETKTCCVPIVVAPSTK